MTGIGIQRLVKNFGPVKVLRDFNLDVGEGEFISLLGPSGCGKTTTLRCVAGFEYPDEGRILFDGKDMTRLAPERRDVGMVFQSYALFPHLTVRENLAFGLEMRRVGPADTERRVAGVLEMVQLAGMEQRYPRELSGGQQQRVALARALVIEPSVLLLDEPLANLDAGLRGDMRYFIRALQRRVGITSIYVTHDQTEAIVMSDRIVVMFDGGIAQVGTPREIHDRPVSRQVAEFVGRSNFLECTVAAAEGSRLRRVDTPVGPLVASAPQGVATGAPASMMVRPESIVLGGGEAGWNSLPATVTESTYLGDAIHLDVRLSDGRSIRVDTRPDCRAAPGDVVEVSFSPESAWLLA